MQLKRITAGAMVAVAVLAGAGSAAPTLAAPADTAAGSAAGQVIVVRDARNDVRILQGSSADPRALDVDLQRVRFAHVGDTLQLTFRVRRLLTGSYHNTTVMFSARDQDGARWMVQATAGKRRAHVVRGSSWAKPDACRTATARLLDRGTLRIRVPLSCMDDPTSLSRLFGYALMEWRSTYAPSESSIADDRVRTSRTLRLRRQSSPTT